jgi:hypothetical protein
MPMPLFLGPAREPAAAGPLVLDPSAERLRVARMDLLLRAGTETSIEAPMGAYLGVVPPAAAAALTSDLEERLRALGYAGDR